MVLRKIKNHTTGPVKGTCLPVSRLPLRQNTGCELHSLIERSMAIDQADRTSAAEVLIEPQANLDKWKLDAGNITPAQRQNNLRVYYKGTEINDMPVGPANFKHTAEQYDILVDDRFMPGEPPLNPPDAVFGRHKVAYLARKRNALDRGLGALFRMRRAANGQMDILPAGNDAPVANDASMNLPFEHEHIQRVRRYIDNRTRQPAQSRDNRSSPATTAPVPRR